MEGLKEKKSSASVYLTSYSRAALGGGEGGLKSVLRSVGRFHNGNVRSLFLDDGRDEIEDKEGRNILISTGWRFEMGRRRGG